MNQYLLSVYEVEGDGAGAPSAPRGDASVHGRVIAALEDEMCMRGDQDH